VIHLEPVHETVSRALAAATTKAFVDYQELDDHLREAENSAILAKKLFPRERPALEMLGEVLGEDDIFHVGSLDGLAQQTGLNRFRAVFANAPDGVMPAVPIVAEVMRKFSWDECVNGLLKPLRKPLSVERLTRILAFLSRRHEENQGSSEHRNQLLEVHGWYLRERVAHGQGFRDVLTGIAPVRLLSRSGRWKTAAELCLGAENIDADHRLDEQHRQIVEPYLPVTEGRSLGNYRNIHGCQYQRLRQGGGGVESLLQAVVGLPTKLAGRHWRLSSGSGWQSRD
jgi:hypothetical protein